MNIFKRTLIACLLMGTMASCGSSEESAAGFIESGKALLAEGNIQKARIEFKNAIQVDPRQAEPFYQLALLDEKAQEWKSMFANLSTVEQLDPNHHAAIVKLGQIHLLAGNFDIALEKADKVLLADNQHIQAIVLRASVFLKQKNFGAALSEADRALKLDANNLEAISVKILANKEQGNADEALKITNDALTSHQDALPLNMIKLTILEGQKDYVGMEAVYRQLIAQHPDANWVVVSLAKLLNNALGRYDDAKKVLQDFIDTHPDDAETKVLLVSLVKTKNPEQAIAILDGYIKADPDNYELRFAKIELLSKEKGADAVVPDLQQIVADDPKGNDGLKAKAILAGIAASKGDFEQAETLVKQVLELSPEDEAALLLKAKLELRNNNVDQAVTDLRLVLRNNPESDKALVLLAQAYMSSGSEELAEDSFKQALSVNPKNPVAALSVANSLMKSNDLARTEEVLLAALKDNPGQESLLQSLAQVRILNKDWTGSEEAIAKLQELNKDSAFAFYLNGQLQQAQQNHALAIAEYKKALANNPNMNRAMQGLASSYLQLDQKPALIDYLNQYIGTNPKLVFGYNTLAKVYQQDKDWSATIKTLEQGVKAEPKWIGGYSSLAASYLAKGDTKQAITAYNNGLSHNPENILLSMQLASVYERTGEYAQAKALYEQVLAKDKDIEPAINNLASLLTDHFESAENLQQALAISKRFKNASEPYFLDTYAWVNVKLGNLQEAKVILERVVSLRETVPVFNYHLGVLYAKQDNKPEAKKYLEIAKKLASEQGDDKLKVQIDKALEQL